MTDVKTLANVKMLHNVHLMAAWWFIGGYHIIFIVIIVSFTLQSNHGSWLTSKWAAFCNSKHWPCMV